MLETLDDDISMHFDMLEGPGGQKPSAIDGVRLKAMPAESHPPIDTFAAIAPHLFTPNHFSTRRSPAHTETTYNQADDTRHTNASHYQDIVWHTGP